jgi:hypothetical protein
MNPAVGTLVAMCIHSTFDAPFEKNVGGSFAAGAD